YLSSLTCEDCVMCSTASFIMRPLPPGFRAFSLHDALPICAGPLMPADAPAVQAGELRHTISLLQGVQDRDGVAELASLNIRSVRSEEHTSELQSPGHLVFPPLLEKKNNFHYHFTPSTAYHY